MFILKSENYDYIAKSEVGSDFKFKFNFINWMPIDKENHQYIHLVKNNSIGYFCKDDFDIIYIYYVENDPSDIDIICPKGCICACGKLVTFGCSENNFINLYSRFGKEYLPENINKNIREYDNAELDFYDDELCVPYFDCDAELYYYDNDLCEYSNWLNDKNKLELMLIYNNNNNENNDNDYDDDEYYVDICFKEFKEFSNQKKIGNRNPKYLIKIDIFEKKWILLLNSKCEIIKKFDLDENENIIIPSYEFINLIN